jgi:hypothetical protein
MYGVTRLYKTTIHVLERGTFHINQDAFDIIIAIMAFVAMNLDSPGM